jgi:molybdenum cofactor guanylyltransferase
MKNTTIFGLILAGGRGSRMDGVDKGLALLDGETLVARTVAKLAPQVGQILISANRNLETYGALKAHRKRIRVVPDLIENYQGPLAGMHAGLHAIAQLRKPPQYVMVVPTDTPNLPSCLVERLYTDLGGTDPADISKASADCAYVTVKDEMHPLTCLVRLNVLDSLEQFLVDEDRRVRNWIKRLNSVAVSFDDYPHAFANYNTPELLALKQDR